MLQVLLCFCHYCIITKSGGGGPSERAGVSHVVDTRSFHEYSHTDLGLFPCVENSKRDNKEQGGNPPPHKKQWALMLHFSSSIRVKENPRSTKITS